ncbi:MAG TPA: RING finger protein [Planctomycetota bacterium]|jgi:hypothetical protein|nr:RING finger protein [Planctomycetota bacterium]
MTSFVNVLASRSDASPVVFIIVIVVVIIAIGSSIARKNQMLAALQRVASQVGGVIDQGGVFSRTGLRFSIGGRNARIEVHAGSKNNPAYTRVSVDLRGRSPGTLHILPEGVGQSFLKMFGAQDLEIGDAAFDASFVIKATPESLARDLFGPERRRSVIRAVHRIQNLGDPRINLDVGHLSVQVRAYVAEEAGLMLLVKTAEEFVGFLLGTPDTPGIQLGEVRVLTGGECPVCGTAMSDQLVRCEVCQTPHHSECWNYMGRCSTYGCRGKRAA